MRSGGLFTFIKETTCNFFSTNIRGHGNCLSLAKKRAPRSAEGEEKGHCFQTGTLVMVVWVVIADILGLDPPIGSAHLWSCPLVFPRELNHSPNRLDFIWPAVCKSYLVMSHCHCCYYWTRKALCRGCPYWVKGWTKRAFPGLCQDPGHAMTRNRAALVLWIPRSATVLGLLQPLGLFPSAVSSLLHFQRVTCEYCPIDGTLSAMLQQNLGSTSLCMFLSILNPIFP